jgi:hypothetical protein
MANAPTINMQGVEVPKTSVDPKGFFSNTRRKRFNEKSISNFAGLGSQDSFTIKQSGIIAALDLKITGSIVLAAGTGTIATTMRWPYDLVQRLVLTANGTTNLVACSGGKLALYRFLDLGLTSDRGVAQGITGASPGTQVNQGTLSLSSESWGLGAGVTSVASGTYNFELYLRVPAAFDLTKLVGAVFGQTNATSLNVEIDWAPQSALFTLTGNAALTSISASVTCEGIVFSIPYGPDGNVVVPKLTAWHKLIQYNDYAVGTGLYGSTLVGQGVGQLLQRVIFQLWNGAAPQTPQALTDTNYGQIGWMYGGDQSPEMWATGGMLRNYLEQLYNTDVGAQWGFGVLDFASHWLARDAVDESTATNLQLMVTPNNALTSPRLEVVQETLSAGSAA